MTSNGLSLLEDGLVSGSSGAAVVIKNCVVRKHGEGGSAVRTVERGTLIQVWKCHDDVRFSLVCDQTLQLESTSLICKLSDIALVPASLWGALFSIPAEARVNLVRDTGLLEKLADINDGSVVSLLGFENEYLGNATVVWKAPGLGARYGLYYGVEIMGHVDTRQEISQIISVRGVKTLPLECDAIVTIQHLRPVSEMNLESKCRASSKLQAAEALTHVPKSVSHHSIRNNDNSVCRRQSSRSLDFTSKIQNFDLPYLGIKNNNHIKTLDLSSPVGKLHQTSHSLDLPPHRRLSRERTSASLDSDPFTPRNNPEPSGAVDDVIYDKLDVGSLVELTMDGYPCYGVIRWLGYLREDRSSLTAGIEMEEEMELDDNEETRGLFTCPQFKALLVPYSRLRKDSRFQDVGRRKKSVAQNLFGQIDCPVVEGIIPPINTELKNICGKNRGIQGHHNSCYLDATLFSMFAFTSVFDSLLYRPPTKLDIPQYSEVQAVLRDEIVNPLRRNLYVRADRVMKLRTLLEKLSSVTGLTSEEKDPEEFLNSLLAQILRAEPFLELSSGQDAFHYQLFVEKDERVTAPSVQRLLEQSFIASNIKLKKLPPCLIVQMPRFGKAFKMYSRILPPTVLDVTDVIEDSPRQCAVCGKLAELECRDCYLTKGLEGGSFCGPCMAKVHSHSSRSRHTARALSVPTEFRELQEHCAVPRLLMHLFAVVCIETSHYVAFLNTDQGWVFFDSMADRKGEQNGYNIPEIVACSDLQFWLSEDGARVLEEMRDERELPELAKRLLCDAYMCMYQSPDVMMYR